MGNKWKLIGQIWKLVYMKMMGTYGESMEVIWENDGTRMGKLWNNDGKIKDTYEKITGTVWKGDGKSTTVQITFHGTWKSTVFHGNSILFG